MKSYTIISTECEHLLPIVPGVESVVRYHCRSAEGSHSDRAPSSINGLFHDPEFHNPVLDVSKLMYASQPSKRKIDVCKVQIPFFCQEGLLRVLLDGGPSRLFLPADAKLLEEDLELLKVRLLLLSCIRLFSLLYVKARTFTLHFILQEFFISGGDGLPRGTVENQVSHVRNVIKLHGCEVCLQPLHLIFLFYILLDKVA